MLCRWYSETAPPGVDSLRRRWPPNVGTCTLVSPHSRRSYDHAISCFITWYCGEPRSDLTASSSPAIAPYWKLKSWHRLPQPEVGGRDRQREELQPARTTRPKSLIVPLIGTYFSCIHKRALADKRMSPAARLVSPLGINRTDFLEGRFWTGIKGDKGVCRYRSCETS